MKPHIIVRLQQPLSHQRIPHWEPFITSKEGEVGSFDSTLDDLFKQLKLPIWVTAEYTPADGSQFNNDEVETGLDRIYRIILRQNTDIPDRLIDQINLDPSVVWVRRGNIASTPIPTYSQSMARPGPTEWPGEMIYLSQAHAFSKGHPDIKIAVLDTGVDTDHPELIGQFTAAKDFVDFTGLDTSSFVGDVLDADDDPEDEVGHGNHISAIIGGHGRKTAGGVSPGCKMIAVRVLAALVQNGKRAGAGLVDNINSGIKWAVDNGADVINMSLGIRHEHGGLPHKDVIEYALKKGVSVVAAAGNDGTDNKYYPGALPGVIAVGAVDHNAEIASFSSFGARISFLAPGTSILSAYRNNDYAASSGTSQAAPFVTGAVALLKSIALEGGRKLRDHQVKYILKHTSERVDRRRHHPKGGYGIINLADAARLLNYELRS